MSNPIRSLWGLLRSPFVAKTYRVETPTGQVLTNVKTATAQKPAAKRQRHKWLNAPIKRINTVGSYSIACRRNVELEKMQLLVVGRLNTKFGKGNFMTHQNRAENCLEVVVLGKKK